MSDSSTRIPRNSEPPVCILGCTDRLTTLERSRMNKKVALQAWEDCIEPMLEFDSIRWTNKTPRKWINLKDFTGPIVVFNSLTETTMSQPEFFLHDEAPGIVWPFNIGTYFSDAEVPTMNYLRTVNPRNPALRGRFWGRPKNLVEWTIGSIASKNNNGTMLREYIELDETYNFKRVVTGHSINGGYDGKTAHPGLVQSAHNIIGISAAVQLTMRYEWTVEIQLQSGLVAAIPGTPAMCRSILALRDIPEGYSRRAALKHLVSAHTRRPDTPVREHLRGRTEFEWNTIRGCVVPSEYDLERLSQ